MQRRLSAHEVEALLADYEAGGRVGELAKVYGIHRTTVSAHVARAGKTRGQLTEARVDEAVRLYEQGWSLRAVGRHLDVADKAIRRVLTAEPWLSVPVVGSRQVGWRRDCGGAQCGVCAYSRVSLSARLGTTNDARKSGKNLLPVHRKATISPSAASKV